VKKVISMILVIAMLACVLAACGNTAKPETTNAPVSGSADGKTYTTTVKGNEVKLTLNDDQTEVNIEVMGMIVVAACEVSDNTLTMKGKISGNDQIWNGFAGATYTLNSDGTAVAN